MINQIQLYSLNEKAFYTKKENEINEILSYINSQMYLLKEFKLYNLLGNKIYKFEDLNDFISQKEENTFIRKYIKAMMKNNKSILGSNEFKKLLKEDELYQCYNEDKKTLEKRLEIKLSLKEYLKKHKKIKNIKKYSGKIKEIKEKKIIPRVLDSKFLKPYNQISSFESSFSRDLNIETNETTVDIFIVKVHHYSIMDNLIKNGFTFWGDKFIPFTASAGQIREKKVIFIREREYERFSNTLMCGLSIKQINESELKGCNVNKFLSYLALIFSATDRWESFDINRAIVIEDFSTNVYGEVDYIDNKTFEVTPSYMPIPIVHSDGCGMILSSESDKNFMFRMPWFKGLCTPCNFISYARKFNNKNFKIVDIYGKEWDLLHDGILYIFSRSQFKMWKYYPNTLNEDGTIKYGWDTYKDNFIKYGCHASKCNEETDKFKDANFNYQMEQTLTNISDDEIDELIKPTKELLTKAYTDKDTMLEVLGATNSNPNKNYLQQALEIYSPLLRDYHIKEKLADTINAKRKDAKFGKIKIPATNLFLIPDIFAWMQFSISGIKDPKGLLDDGEVFCKLYNGASKLLVDRSPHLFREHAIRNNAIDKIKSFWFTTDAVYTSCHDLISKTLQFDNDGDKSIVIVHKKIIEIAERNMKGVLPLYYRMGTADAKLINNFNIWKSLKSAFKFGNIGTYSNKLTKLWNVDERQRDEQVCKILCSLNNYSIDAAKSLIFPEIPSEINERIKKVDKIKLPYFFKFAKDKESEKLATINKSTVNRICKKIEKIEIPDYNFEGIDNFKSEMLLNDKEKKIINAEITKKYNELNKLKSKWFYRSKLPKEEIANAIYARIKKELLEVDPKLSIAEVVDIVIRHIYKYKKTTNERKSFLFNCFGDIILENLKSNIENKMYINCSVCGDRTKKESNRQKMCETCAEKSKQQKDSLRKKKKKSPNLEIS